MTATRTKEFTLPFVGREEELQFLLNEYDQMLHAQYRSIWIEAPAGMGKTTLVEEFLRRISVGAQQKAPQVSGVKKNGGALSAAPLRPWIVHAHLRERSSNSLASFVEALGSTLQTLTEQQQEKLFSGLTSFYKERAKKIVGGGNVQSMDMEEAITTAGYVLKKLSFYFPLVIIIEDIHVLKGEISFYALRHLQAIVEHVPMMMIFITRPSEEKNWKQFEDILAKEGCKKYEVKSLKYEDVERLVETSRVSGRLPGEGAKNLMHLSGGNALLLRELLRSGSIDENISPGATTEKIIHQLTRELEHLPKRDRQVIAIAGILGEEFSELLLREITGNKDFKCWSEGVLERLEQKGIIRRRKKTLKPEGEGKEISLKVGVFAHALWWEAARKLYVKEKTWTDRKFANAIVPLLSHEDYPLLTDAELIVNLYQWVSQRNSLLLLQYTMVLCGSESQWAFHSESERRNILAKARGCIQDILRRKAPPCNTKQVLMMIELVKSEKILTNMDKSIQKIAMLDNKLINELLSFGSEKEHEIVWPKAENLMHVFYTTIFRFADNGKALEVEKQLWLLKKKHSQTTLLSAWIDILLDRTLGLNYLYKNTETAVKYFLQSIERAPWNSYAIRNMAVVSLLDVSLARVDQVLVENAVTLAQKFRLMTEEVDDSMFIRRMGYRAEIELLLKAGKVISAGHPADQLCALAHTAWRKREKFVALCSVAKQYAYEGKRSEAMAIVKNLFSDEFSSLNIITRFKWIAPHLFLLEEWSLFQELWEKFKNELVPEYMPSVIPLFERRLFMCLLEGDREQQKEIESILKKVIKEYPLLKNNAENMGKKVNTFSFSEKNLQQVKKDFDNFITLDKTLSPFDKAHYSYLFARIGVRYGHKPKEFRTYVHQSLQGFEKLGLDKRVVFTAEKLFEANLLSKKELSVIFRKYKSDKKESNQPEVRIEQPSDSSSIVPDEQGITLRCSGQIRAFDPSGTEIIKKQWGSRKTASHHRHIVAELVRASFERRTVTRGELLRALYPEIKSSSVSDKKLSTLDHVLTVYFYELKKIFSPYTLFEKTKEGYRLHPSVKVDVLEYESLLKKAQNLAATAPPSAAWLLQHIIDSGQGGEFAKGIVTKEIIGLRRRIKEKNNEAARLLDKVRETMVL